MRLHYDCESEDLRRPPRIHSRGIKQRSVLIRILLNSASLSTWKRISQRMFCGNASSKSLSVHWWTASIVSSAMAVTVPLDTLFSSTSYCFSSLTSEADMITGIWSLMKSRSSLGSWWDWEATWLYGPGTKKNNGALHLILLCLKPHIFLLNLECIHGRTIDRRFSGRARSDPVGTIQPRGLDPTPRARTRSPSIRSSLENHGNLGAVNMITRFLAYQSRDRSVERSRVSRMGDGECVDRQANGHHRNIWQHLV
jgi:hypothetical protein